jgi:hypothetical protein
MTGTIFTTHGTAVCQLSFERPVRVVGFIWTKARDQLVVAFCRKTACRATTRSQHVGGLCVPCESEWVLFCPVHMVSRIPNARDALLYFLGNILGVVNVVV